MRRFFSRFFILIFVILLVLTAGFLFYRSMDKAPEYQTATVVRSSLTSFVSASGNVYANTKANLHFQTYGKLAWVGVKVGDRVEKWQAIASLDQRILKKDITKALRDYSKERNDFEEDKAVTYQGRYFTDTVKRILEKNQWDLDKSVIDVEIETIALELANLYAPVTGVVTRIDTPVAGVNVTATNIFEITDPSSIIFQAEVDEVDIGNILVGQKVNVFLDSYPDLTFSGYVEKIGFTAITGASGGTTFLVDINLPYSENTMFRPGMNGDAEIITQKKSDIVILSYDVIMEDNDGTYIYVLENNTPVRKPVTTGIEGDSAVEIISGVNEDEVIITNPDIIEE